MISKSVEREDILAATLAELEAAEPAGLRAEDPFDCDVLAGDADRTLGMWSITWSTKQN